MRVGSTADLSDADALEQANWLAIGASIIRYQICRMSSFTYLLACFARLARTHTQTDRQTDRLNVAGTTWQLFNFASFKKSFS